MATHRTLILVIMTILCFRISVKQHLPSKTILKTYEKMPKYVFNYIYCIWKRLMFYHSGE